MLQLHAAMSWSGGAGTAAAAPRLSSAALTRGVEIENMQTQRNGVIETAEQAQGTIAETAQTVKDTAADLGARAADMGAKATEYAREAGRQASTAAQTAYSTGNDVLDVVESFTRENVWGSLLIAGAVGYGLACLIKNTR
jgi:ElaB/YqjD/DUF883 family membrane-anchored ribosome-binding protein